GDRLDGAVHADPRRRHQTVAVREGGLEAHPLRAVVMPGVQEWVARAVRHPDDRTQGNQATYQDHQTGATTLLRRATHASSFLRPGCDAPSSRAARCAEA